jgi:hypothetical protein
LYLASSISTCNNTHTVSKGSEKKWVSWKVCNMGICIAPTQLYWATLDAERKV